MSWVNTTAVRSVPTGNVSPEVALLPVPHTPLLLLVTASSLVAYHASTLLPLAVHARPHDSLETHGVSVEAHVRQVAPASASADFSRTKSGSVFIRTAHNYTLIYSIGLNHQKPAYEVVHAASGATLQNSLPVAHTQAQTSLGAMLRMATRTLLHGDTSQSNMANVEHFEYEATDDDSRNEAVPSVRLSLAKVIKVSSEIRRFWSKPNSHNMIFYNHLNQLQLLNYKTLRTESVSLDRWPEMQGLRRLEYCMSDNSFMCLTNSNDLRLLHVSSDPRHLEASERRPSVPEPDADAVERSSGAVEDASLVSVKEELLAHVDFEIDRLVFSPQANIILLLAPVAESVQIRIHHLSAQSPRLHSARTIVPFSSCTAVTCEWSPCGSFFACLNVDSGFWKMYSKHGSLLFDSDVAHSDLFLGEGEEQPDHFCRASHLSIAPNSMAVHVLSQRKTLFKLDLLRLHEATHKLSSFPLLYDDSYISIPYSHSKHMVKVPLLPSFQKVLAQMHVSGAPSKRHSALSARLTMQLNSFDQLSLAYGASLCISTPTCLGSVHNHVFWYQFYNHSMSAMNIVNHFWLDDFLVLINRYEDPDAIDEIVVLDTSNSKFGSIGQEFKFDSDLILWRHTFKNQILNCNISGSSRGGQTLVLLADDLRLIVMEFEPKGPASEYGAEKQRLLRATKTIHLSSIKNKISLDRIKDMINIQEKHFFFLLNTGDLYLLKNQSANESGVQTKNMYELVLIGHGVERVEVGEIQFNLEKRKILTLNLGDKIHVYNFEELLEATEMVDEQPLEVAGVDNVAGARFQCRPVTIETSAFYPLRLGQKSAQGETTLEVLGLEYQTSTKHKHLLVKQRVSRVLVVSDFLYRDLMNEDLAEGDERLLQIHDNYVGFKSYNYCLEVLLFKSIDDVDSLVRVKKLIERNPKKNQIFVSFLRKIEASHWARFFATLEMTPLQYMNNLFVTNDVDLCYSYLNIYLKRKREYGDEDQDLLGGDEKIVVLHILRMLKSSKRWEQFLEVCRFIKFLQPEGQIFEDIQLLANDRSS